jgi:hypothetical protein
MPSVCEQFFGILAEGNFIRTDSSMRLAAGGGVQGTEVGGALMSALGHKQTCAAQTGMSALPPKAEMCGALADVR